MEKISPPPILKGPFFVNCLNNKFVVSIFSEDRLSHDTPQMASVGKVVLYLLEATLLHTLDGSSSFSMTYCVMKLPPSLRGGFHDNTTESSRIFSQTGNLGGSGWSEN